jgi:hypothetical protein
VASLHGLAGSGAYSSRVAYRAHIAATVRETLLALWPGRLAPTELHDGASLGEGGLGLDSIEIVEFLLVCEDRCSGRVTEDLLERGPVSIRGVIDHFAVA